MKKSTTIGAITAGAIVLAGTAGAVGAVVAMSAPVADAVAERVEPIVVEEGEEEEPGYGVGGVTVEDLEAAYRASPDWEFRVGPIFFTGTADGVVERWNAADYDYRFSSCIAIYQDLVRYGDKHYVAHLWYEANRISDLDSHEAMEWTMAQWGLCEVDNPGVAPALGDDYILPNLAGYTVVPEDELWD